MPYLASNQDVNKQETYTNALIIGSLVLGAAAIGGAMSNSKMLKSMQKTYDKDDIVKNLYGGKAKNIKLSDQGWDNLKARSFAMNEDGFAPGVNRYQAGRTFTGKSKMKRTDGNFIQNAWTNWTDKDLKMFNKDIKQLQKSKNLGPDNLYTQSKLSLYDRLERGSRDLNTNSKELMDMTENIYNSKAYRNRRYLDKFNGIDNDVEVTNKVWGDMFGSDDTYNYKEYNRRKKKKNKPNSAPSLGGPGVGGSSSATSTGVAPTRQRWSQGRQTAPIVEATPMGGSPTYGLPNNPPVDTGYKPNWQYGNQKLATSQSQDVMYQPGSQSNLLPYNGGESPSKKSNTFK